MKRSSCGSFRPEDRGARTETSSIVSRLQAQNAVRASGVLQEGHGEPRVGVNGQFALRKPEAINLKGVNDRFFPLNRCGNHHARHADRPKPLFRFNASTRRFALAKSGCSRARTC